MANGRVGAPRGNREPNILMGLLLGFCGLGTHIQLIHFLYFSEIPMKLLLRYDWKLELWWMIGYRCDRDWETTKP